MESVEDLGGDFGGSNDVMTEENDSMQGKQQCGIFSKNSFDNAKYVWPVEDEEELKSLLAVAQFRAKISDSLRGESIED